MYSRKQYKYYQKIQPHNPPCPTLEKHVINQHVNETISEPCFPSQATSDTDA